ncbi:spermatogenesis-associated protein 2 [Alosa alosa]|uniref:spermatogenesis-associated protein 2 n=1 Tax=Alosa alosa TaxID=278164 RepID=UPI0020153F64|nr:spermatogenesis-associated protein 2 [Alosa alosa]
MDAKLREDLFRRYVASLERRLEEGEGSSAKGDRPTTTTTAHSSSEEALVSTATALLGAYQPEPSQRFRLLRFYEVTENALRSPRGSSLRALEAAFATLETVCTNLLLFPWKKEFRCIKTFTGPYVYQLQSAMCESDLRSLLRSMGYTRSEQDTHYQARETPPGGALHLRQLAFELLLAQAECRLLGEVVALARGAATELEALELRRASREDAAGCAEALRRRDSLAAMDMARLSLRPADMERAATPHHHHHHHHHHQLRRSGRPSKSVDVTDSAGHWHPASKPVLRTSLSLRKEPLFVDAEEEEARDEILRPNAPLFSLASTPSYSPSSSSSSIAAVASAADFFPIQSPPPPSSSDPYSYHLSSLDEVDLYTERGGSGGGAGGMALGGRQTPSSSASSSSRPPSREPRDGWLLKAHSGAKCQGCGLGCSVLSSCQRCDTVLCSSCMACEPTPCCGYQDYPKVATVTPPALLRQLDGYLPAKEKLSVYSNAHMHTHPHTHPHAHVISHSHLHPHPHPHPLSHSHSQLLDKPMMSGKLYPSKPVAMVTTSAPSGIGVSDRLSVGSSSRCGFCNKPGAAHTCVNCSKVSCDSCMGLYGGDVCTRKTPHHSFLPNHQLNFKSSTISHLVYR